MAIAKKEALYWTSCLLYGILLTCVLLYLRFPTDKFRRYCERLIEVRLADVTCSIGKIEYAFPATMVLTNIELHSQKNGSPLLYEDPKMSFTPVWRSPLHYFDVQSSAYGGNHKGRLYINTEENRLAFSDLRLDKLDLTKLTFLQGKLDRKLTGTVKMEGTAELAQDTLLPLASSGTIAVNGGLFGLKKPILELNTIELTDTSLQFNFNSERVEISKGSLKSKNLAADFSGVINFTDQWWGSSIGMQGTIVPQAALFQERKHLRIVVSQMQKRLNKTALPFIVGGTIGSPTFMFEK